MDRGQANQRTRLPHTQQTPGATPGPATKVFTFSGPWYRIETTLESLLEEGWAIEALSPYLLPDGSLHVVGAMVQRG